MAVLGSCETERRSVKGSEGRDIMLTYECDIQDLEESVGEGKV